MNNRGFLYGDGCFETLRLVNGRIIHDQYHVQRLKRAFEILGFDGAKLSVSYLYDIISAEGINGDNLRVRLSFYRAGAGLYTPESHDWQIEIQHSELSDLYYKHQVYHQISTASTVRIMPSIFSSIKSLSAMPYVMIGKEKKKKKWAECLVLNQMGRIAEGSCTNFFMLSQNQIITPAISEGCIDGVMRKVIMDRLHEMGLDIREGQIEIDDLCSADELFVTNAIKGVHSIGSLSFGPQKTYQTSLACSLVDQLNRLI